MKIAYIAALASLANAVSIDVSKRETPLEVKLEMTGNTAVKASITNTGAEDLKVFKTGSFLDKNAVEKVEVFQGGSQVAFEGVRLRISTASLDEASFQIIAAGQTLETSFDVAEMHDLSTGGSFDLKSTGALSYAEADSTNISGVVSYSSNTLSVSVDGVQAEKVRRTWLKRSIVQSDCTGTRRTAIVNALANCRTLALAAASAASSNSAKLNEYFKSTTSSTVSTVSTVFNRVATECGSTTSGVAKVYCTDVYPGGACSSNVLAYTVPSQSYEAYCPLFFNNLPALTRTCHAQDQATTVLHETTHLTQIRGTSDLAYGYTAVRALSASQEVNNADTYALFANAIYAGC